MNDFDLTDLMENVCSDYWDSRIMIDGRTPWSEQTRDTQNKLKEQVLPWIYRAAPQLLKKMEADMHQLVLQAREIGMSDTEIVDQLVGS